MRILLAVLLFAFSAVAQGFDAWLPDNTLLYLSLDDLGRTRESFERGPLRALFDDAEMQPFLETPKAMWKAAMEEQKREDGTNVEEFWEFMQKHAALAFVWMPGQEAPDFVMFIELGEKEAEFREWLNRMDARDEEKGESRMREDEFQGVPIVLLHSLKEGDEEREPMCRFMHRGNFVLSTGVGAAKEVITRIVAEDGQNLAANEAYQTARARTGARSDVFLYVDLATVLQRTNSEEELQMLKLLGLASLKTLSLQATLRDDGLLTNVFLSAPGEKTGILKLLSGENSVLHPPAFLPEKTSAAITWNVDLAGLVKGVMEILAATGTGMDQMIAMQLGAIKEQTGVDIVEDLLGSFGKETATFFVPNDDGGAAAGEAMVTTIRIADRERLQRAVETLLGMNPAVKETEYLGVKIREADQLAVAMLENHMVYGMSADGVRAVIRRYGKQLKSVRESEDYQRVTSLMPEQRYFLWFSNPEWDRGPSMVGQMFWRGFWMGLSQAAPAAAIRNAIPDEKILKKYRGPIAFALSNAEDGILIAHFFGMKKAEAAPEEEAPARAPDVTESND